jgi:alkanesulfonate monooxygenase SsuD/methylene tetrahydromethanopterin reductase-like flavin-dependent oxidoreductase (luciferase family)
MAVTCPNKRHPAISAQTAATIDQMSNGRFIMGIGPGAAINLVPFGIEFKKPVSKMVEFIEVTRRLWKGGKIDFNGEFYKLKNAFLQVKPVQETIPYYIAANGPRTRKITGRIADGWMPCVENPKTYEMHLKEIEEGAKDVRKDLKDFDASLQIYMAISDDEKEIERLKINARGMIFYFPSKLLEAGYNLNLPEGIGLDYPIMEMLADDEGMEKQKEVIQCIPEEAVDDFSLIGDVDDIIEKMNRFVRSGLKHFCLVGLDSNPKEVMKIYGEKIIPYFKEK